MVTGIEVYMFTLMCQLQIEKHRYDYKHNWDYYYKNNGGSKICKLERQKCSIVKAYMNCLPILKKEVA